MSETKTAERGTNTAPADTAAMVPAAQGAATIATQHHRTMAQAFQGLMPTSIGEAYILAGYLSKGGAVPGSLKGKPEAVLTVVLAGMELGLTPIRALQSITNISGNLSMRADLQLALTRRSGVLEIYDESYEVKGQTDTNLPKRIQRILRKEDPEDVALVIDKIQAASGGLQNGNPWAWALAKRNGDSTIHVRTFTYADAMKAVIFEKDEDNPGAKKEPKPLAMKFNYQSFPGDMYPKRARGRVLQAVASDVLAGLPAVEAIEGGQILEGEFSRAEDTGGGDLNDLLQAIEDQDPEACTTIRNAFAQLRLGPAHQLQKLVQFKGRPADLVEWLKLEYANRRGVDTIKRPDALGDQPAATQQPAQTQPAVQDAQVITEPAAKTEPAKTVPVQDAITQVAEAMRVQRDTEPAAEATEPAKQPAKSKAASLADRFRKGTSF